MTKAILVAMVSNAVAMVNKAVAMVTKAVDMVTNVQVSCYDNQCSCLVGFQVLQLNPYFNPSHLQLYQYDSSFMFRRLATTS